MTQFYLVACRALGSFLELYHEQVVRISPPTMHNDIRVYSTFGVFAFSRCVLSGTVLEHGGNVLEVPEVTVIFAVDVPSGELMLEINRQSMSDRPFTSWSSRY